MAENIKPVGLGSHQSKLGKTATILGHFCLLGLPRFQPYDKLKACSLRHEYISITASVRAFMEEVEAAHYVKFALEKQDM